MCGIVGAVAQRDVAPILLEGLKRLEYRGYDSAGMAIIDAKQLVKRHRAVGKVKELAELLAAQPLYGSTGIAHTRWATHGKPSEQNAHPLISNEEVVVVHNGIIENHEVLRTKLLASGYRFSSETDTEVVAHLLHQYLAAGKDFLTAVQTVAKELEGAFAIVFMHRKEPGRLIGLRRGSPLVIGIGIGEHFFASDQLALLPVAQKFIYLAEDDLADITRDNVTIYDKENNIVRRAVQTSNLSHDVADKGQYRHYMLKEIFEQPEAVAATLQGRLSRHQILTNVFGERAEHILPKVKRVHIVACGTSYHAGMVGRYWLEELANIPCQVEIASEYRYRNPVVENETLFVTLSQSGETVDTLAAFRAAKTAGYLSTLVICNAPESSLVRESELVFLTHAGPEIGVASTKAFTTQLVALLLLTIVLGRYQKSIDSKKEAELVESLESLPKKILNTLALDKTIQQLADHFADKHNSLFIARGVHYPIVLEGALKLKEISYIHAEAYPAGELKHGALALVDHEMPVIALAPANELIDKLKSNLQEVRARGDDVILFCDEQVKLENTADMRVIKLPEVEKILSPIIHTIPLQLLAYYVAVCKGTDVDQPRNLAKSVTVE